MTDLHTKSQLTTIEVRNPADGTVVGEIPVDTPMRAAAAHGLRRFGLKPKAGRK